VILAENGGGSGVFESLVVVLNQHGLPKQSGSAALGDRVKVNAVTIQDQRIRLDLTVQGPNDPMCCPTLPKTQTYRLSQNTLILTHLVSKTAQGAERSITITNLQDGSQVSSPAQVKGSVTIAPFENSLVYRLIDQAGNKLAEGPLPVQASQPGGAGLFDATVDLSAVKPGTAFFLSIADLSAADGTTQAQDAVELTLP
jgi:hypothetical protein